MQSYSWYRRGDFNAFFGLMLDNLAVMVILVSTISAPEARSRERESGKFSTEFVLTRMIPGTAIGVLLGDLIYTAMAFRLARKTGKTEVTAMPLGLDTPSTFAVAFLVLLPALNVGWQRYNDHEKAMEFAWNVGVVVLVAVGLFKIVMAPLGNLVRRLVPRAGLLGSLAAIALALIAFVPLLLDGIIAVPLVGMVTLGIILLSLVAHRDLPGKIPGALAAVVLGLGIYHLSIVLGSQLGWKLAPSLEPMDTNSFTWKPLALWPWTESSPQWWSAVIQEALTRLPVIFPFALATIVGGIDCTESAAAAGDEYDTRSILLTEGIASFAAGLLGGVIQTTPYIGHPAYKKMGGRAAYTLATALFIGVAGYFGWFTYLFAWMPKAAMYPILVFVGLEITAQSFQSTPRRHYPALVFAIMPALAYMVILMLTSILGPSLPATEEAKLLLQTLRCLANGFLITSLLWSAMLARVIDGKTVQAALFLLIAAVFSLFGVMHSPLAAERIGLPWEILQSPEMKPMLQAVQYQTPFHWAGAYLLMALSLLLLDRNKPGTEEELDQEPLGPI